MLKIVRGTLVLTAFAMISGCSTVTGSETAHQGDNHNRTLAADGASNSMNQTLNSRVQTILKSDQFQKLGSSMESANYDFIGIGDAEYGAECPCYFYNVYFKNYSTNDFRVVVMELSYEASDGANSSGPAIKFRGEQKCSDTAAIRTVGSAKATGCELKPVNLNP